jgi:hypothetical protein
MELLVKPEILTSYIYGPTEEKLDGRNKEGHEREEPA